MSKATSAAAMDVDSTRKYLSAEAAPVMQEGISLTLSKWPALQMALDNGWGGPHSRNVSYQFVDELLSWFVKTKELDIYDLEDMLLDFMEYSMHTMIEDGSIEEIAESLMLMHEECVEGNYGSVERLRGKARVATVSHTRQVLDDEDDDSEDESEGQGGNDMLKMAIDAMNSSSNTRLGEGQGGNGMPNMAIDAMNSSSNTRLTTTKPVEVEDGWTLVSSSKKKKKKAGR